MADAFTELLDATLEHLQALQRRGVRFVRVAPETLRALREPPPARPRPSVTKPGAPPAATPEAGQAPITRIEAAVPKAVELQDPAAQGLLLPGLGGAPPAAGAALPPEARAAAWADLRARVEACQKCPHLAATRQHVVFGVGNPEAELMFIGEAPGADEDAQGEPFVGRAGELLTRIIAAMGLARSDVYIANILKCRPDTPSQTSGNRKPTTTEMQTCLPYLLEQIDLIRPRVLVALGATAVEGLFGKPVSITKLRGQWQTFRGTPVMPTYHPAYVLRNPSPTVKREIWQDMLQVMERLGLPITDKQRRYFTSSS